MSPREIQERYMPAGWRVTWEVGPGPSFGDRDRARYLAYSEELDLEVRTGSAEALIRMVLTYHKHGGDRPREVP